MQVIRPVGREAATKKYDILSAMMAHALAGDQNRQRLVLRLMALITTRYNWQRNELSVGQREIARLWCVDERTVKRDMARLRQLGWVEIKRQGARGRVAVLGLDLERIMLDTRPQWPNIGEDFVSRAGRQSPDSERTNDRTVVPFRKPVGGDGGTWDRMAQLLIAEDPATYEAWFAGLRQGDCGAGCLELLAPTRFHATYLRTHFLGRLQIAARRVDPSISVIRISTV